MKIRLDKCEPLEIRLIFIMFTAAFINFDSPFYGSLFVLFFELSFIHIFYSRYKEKIKSSLIIITKNIILSISLFIILSTLSTIIMLTKHWGDYQSTYGFLRYISIIIHILFSLTLSMYFIYKPINEYIFIPVALSIALASTIIIFDYNFNADSVMNHEANRTIISSNIRYLGYITMMGCIYCITSLVLSNTRKVKALFSILFVVNFSLLFWLGGRGAIVAFMVTFVISILMTKETIIKKLNNILLTFWLMTLSCIVSYPLNVYSWNGINRFFNLSKDLDLSLEQFSTGRFALWEESISLIKESPIWGYGPEAHIFLTKIGFLQPHNIILQLLLEFGIFGTLSFLFILYCIINKSIYNVRTDMKTNSLYCFGVIFSITIHSLYDGSLYHAPPVILFCIASAYVLAENFKLTKTLTNHQINTVDIKEK